MNTGAGMTTDSGATNSGFGNTGTGISGFFNSAGGGSGFNGIMSGFFNSASGGTANNGAVSGFFNQAVPTAQFPLVAEDVSGLLNVGNAITGLFSLSKLIQAI